MHTVCSSQLSPSKGSSSGQEGLFGQNPWSTVVQPISPLLQRHGCVSAHTTVLKRQHEKSPQVKFPKSSVLQLLSNPNTRGGHRSSTSEDSVSGPSDNSVAVGVKDGVVLGGRVAMSGSMSSRLDSAELGRSDGVLVEVPVSGNDGAKLGRREGI